MKTVADEILDSVAPRLQRGELSLLLGSGFSRDNENSDGLKIPNTESLKEAILKQAGTTSGPKTTLKDAYLFGQRNITPDFNEFLASLFSVTAVAKWQEKIFYYAWKRIYTTNIDNVLDVAYEQARLASRLSGDFTFFNYCDQSLVSDTLASIPVVTVHGTCKKLDEGFIFSALEYARSTAKVLDWHRDLAARALTGGLVVVGNQLEESDFDSYIAQRKAAYPDADHAPVNWIIMPDPDPVKAANYADAGYHVLDCTAEFFFETIFGACAPRTVADIVLDSNPSLKRAVTSAKALTWFRSSFRAVSTEIESARKETGLLRHFMMGAEPEWFYITQSAHAPTDRATGLKAAIARSMTQKTGVGILQVVGPSGSGKTTALKASLQDLVGTFPYIYEFSQEAGIDADLLRSIIAGFTSKSILVFYSAFEFYYAVNYIAQHFARKDVPFCLFVLEDRLSDYKGSSRHLKDVIDPSSYPLEPLELPDATSIAQKIEAHGLVFDKFSELPLTRRAREIVDAERGFGGDLLTTLFSLTTHENFEQKIHQDYYRVKDETARRALESIAILTSFGLPLPIHYLAGFINVSVSEVQHFLETELAGIAVRDKNNNIHCRHRIIAEFYVTEVVSKHGSSALIIDILTFLSRQFKVSDIKRHPLPYRMYKEIINLEFLYDRYFSDRVRLESTEAVYHICQSLYGTDGIFWLHVGRFYRKVDRLDDAIEAFRTGLTYYDSFQTRHSLGVALLDRYIHSHFESYDDYNSGVELLESERISRGDKDPYPTATLLEWLQQIVRNNPQNLDARGRLKNCINFALQHFRDDERTQDAVKGATRSLN